MLTRFFTEEGCTRVLKNVFSHVLIFHEYLRRYNAQQRLGLPQLTCNTVQEQSPHNRVGQEEINHIDYEDDLRHFEFSQETT